MNCTEINCTKLVKARRLCTQHLSRLYRYGDSTFLKMPPAGSIVKDQAWLEANCIPEPNTGCWIWLNSADTSNGLANFLYGTTNYQGRRFKAHRFAWIIANGEIPIGLNVLHKCDFTLCVNKDHLFLGTQRDNMRDCAAKRRTGNQRAARALPWG